MRNKHIFFQIKVRSFFFSFLFLVVFRLSLALVSPRWIVVSKFEKRAEVAEEQKIQI